MKIPKFIDNKLRKHYYEDFVKQEHKPILEIIPAESICFKNKTFMPVEVFERYNKDEAFRKDVLCKMFGDALLQITKTTSLKHIAYSKDDGYDLEVELRGFKY